MRRRKMPRMEVRITAAALLNAMEVRITVAGPQHAKDMEWLKFGNLMFRGVTGELPMSDDEFESTEVTEESIAELAVVLAASNESDYYLVADYNERIVGFCRMTWRPESAQFQLRQFYVEIELRGRGIGSQIIRIALERTRQSPFAAKGVFLITGDYNTAAQARYVHWGFKIVGTGKTPLGESDTEGQWLRMDLDF